MWSHIYGEKYNVHIRLNPQDKAVLKALSNIYGIPYTAVILKALDALIETDAQLIEMRNTILSEYPDMELQTLNPSLTLGQRVRIFRLEKGYTQQQLAMLVGFKSRSSIHKIEADMVDVTQSQLKALSNALGVSPSVLTGWIPSKAVKAAISACLGLD